MTEQEQIEVWRQEFIKIAFARHSITYNVTTGEFVDNHCDIYWNIFLAAKRAQNPVELPKPEMCFTSSKSGHGSFAYVHLDPLIESLESAGIPYTVKGE